MVMLAQTLQLSGTAETGHAGTDDNDGLPLWLLWRLRLLRPLGGFDLHASKVDVSPPHEPLEADISHIKPATVFGTANGLLSGNGYLGIPHPKSKYAVADVEVRRDLRMADMVPEDGIFLLV